MGHMAQTCVYILNGNVIHECICRIYEVFETNMIKRINLNSTCEQLAWSRIASRIARTWLTVVKVK